MKCIDCEKMERKNKKTKTNKNSPSQHQVIIKRDTAPRNPHNEAEVSFTKHSTELT